MPVHTEQKIKRVRVRVEYDQSAESPRTYDNMGTLITMDRWGIEVEGKQRRDVNGVGARRMVHEYLRGESVAARADLPSSIHRGDGYEGFIYVTRATVVKEYGDASPASIAKALACITAEAETFRAWCDGMAFGFTVETLETCPECGNESITDEDSCWGFITNEPERDLGDWMGEHMDDSGRAALAIALADGWTGDYPNAGTGTVPA